MTPHEAINTLLRQDFSPEEIRKAFEKEFDQYLVIELGKFNRPPKDRLKLLRSKKWEYSDLKIFATISGRDVAQIEMDEILMAPEKGGE